MYSRSLDCAKSAKDDEFYTQLADVERELYAYIDYNKNIFRNKTILLPCDDPEWSAFTQFFVQQFDNLRIKKLISTSYSPGNRASCFVLEKDPNRKHTSGFKHMKSFALRGDGDFRSIELTELRNQADFVITNPPFSLIKQFLPWIFEGKKSFAIIAPKNAYTYSQVFPHVLSGNLWPGSRPMSQDMLFRAPEDFDPSTVAKSASRIIHGVTYRRAPAVWMTNIEHGRRHEPLDCLKMRRAKNKYKETFPDMYDSYENYNAIEVTTYKAIPSDYMGVMGIPPTCLDKICPEQFKILGATESQGKGFSNGLWDPLSGVKKPICNGEEKYARIFIQAIK